jgi:hypothetical protein
MATLTADQKHCLEIIEAWHTPMVYHTGGWEDTVPKWFLNRAIAERVAMIDDGGWNRASDAEISGYLMTASLCFPFDGDWTNITCYEAAKQVPQLLDVMGKNSEGRVMFGESLTSDQQRQLDDLKFKMRNSQIKRYKEKSKEVIMSKRKIVIDERDGSVMVGVMKEGADPIINTLKYTLEESLTYIPALVTDAETKWALSPKNPKYVAPEPPKPVEKAGEAGSGAGETGKTSGALPLLAGKDSAAAGPAVTSGIADEAKIGGLIPVSEAIKIAEAQGGSQAELDAKAAETAGQPVADVAAAAPGSAAPGGATSEAKPTQAPTAPAASSENSTPPAASSPTAPPAGAGAPTGVWEYMLEDGRGPFESVQAAMDAMNLDKATRPQHNRWDRLSTDLKKRIPRREKQTPK